MSGNIEVVSASAGSGKTHELMNVMYDEIASGKASPDGVMAVTFMVKAAGELVTRVRQRLIEGGKVELAQGMEAARIGTVHSICGRLLSEFAYELGDSPIQRVIDEEESILLFRQILGEILTSKQEQELKRLSFVLDRPIADLLNDAFSISQLARQNNVQPEEILKSIPDSIAQIGRAFPAVVGTDLDAGVLAELDAFTNAHAAPPDTTKVTDTAFQVVCRASYLAKDGRLSWRDWLDLSVLTSGKKSQPLFDPIVESARGFLGHPRLHADISSAISLVHEIAANAMSEFSKKKRSLGVVDYKDMEQRALHLLDMPVVQERLKGELQLLLVDEFQDTNPVQLAIFLKLSKLCARTVWVGDAKQSILGFTGADANLMRAVVKQIGKGTPKILGDSWRSRKELVEFSSEVFSAAFAEDGFDKKEVVLKAATTFKSDLPPIALWRLAGKTLPLRWASLACEIKAFIESKPTVVDRNTGEKRQLVPGDISVLAPTNDWCESIANAIRAVGIDASFSSGSLMAQPEVLLAIAAYRYAIDENDRLAAGEIAILTGADPEKWLIQALGEAAPATWSGILEKLGGLRKKCVEFTPVELLDEVIAVAGIESFVERLVNGADRLANLASLRGLAVSYEDRCTQILAPCTAIGFLSHVSDLAKDEKDPVPGWSRPGAVDVSTLHKSKGLEWPVVIVAGLDKKYDRSGGLFGPRVVGRPIKDFNAEEPLEGRGVRYMPWPFGGKGVDAIEQRLAADGEVQSLTIGAAAELRRLLYVALTRPREMLVMAVSDAAGSGAETYIGALRGNSGTPLISYPALDGTEIGVGTLKFPCVVKAVSSREVAIGRGLRCVLPDPVTPEKRSSLLHVASSGIGLPDKSEAEVTVGEIIDLGGRLQLTGAAEDDVVGNAVHAFLAADGEALGAEGRLGLAKETVARWKLSGVLAAEELVAAADRLNKAVALRWPMSSIVREIPVSVKVRGDSGVTVVKGILDYLVREAEAAAVIDHKTTAIPQTAVHARAKAHCPQLAAYSLGLTGSLKTKQVTSWLHYPMGGFLAEVRMKNPEGILAEALKEADRPMPLLEV